MNTSEHMKEKVSQGHQLKQETYTGQLIATSIPSKVTSKSLLLWVAQRFQRCEKL